jgi:hypothetical protein
LILTDANNRGQVSQGGIANPLRNCETGNGDSGDEITLEKVQIVARSPFEDRKDVLQTHHEFFGCGLVLKFPKRVVRKECLFY